jgi:ketosteroid isomerase-like protein
MSPSKEQLLEKVTTASATWKAAFNSGDAKLCAEQYAPTALMVAKPFGTLLVPLRSKPFGKG